MQSHTAGTNKSTRSKHTHACAAQNNSVTIVKWRNLSDACDMEVSTQTAPNHKVIQLFSSTLHCTRIHAQSSLLWHLETWRCLKKMATTSHQLPHTLPLMHALIAKPIHHSSHQPHQSGNNCGGKEEQAGKTERAGLSVHSLAYIRALKNMNISSTIIMSRRASDEICTRLESETL